ncbi:MAG: hypothetical protein M3178_17375 [Pseudomonadota bacterium]|nr:hypothetical protein [Pseudomonadota bacterium]
MTTKPKTRKASAAKRATPKAAAKQASGEPKREVSEICRLVARLRVLEAEKAYQAAIAGTDEENETLICQHDNEQDEIEMELSRSIPQDFDEVRELLEFAVGMREAGFRSDGADQMILRNILESLHNVTEAARNAGMEEMRRTINFVTENAHRLLDGELDIRRAIDRAQFSEAIGMPRA